MRTTLYTAALMLAGFGLISIIAHALTTGDIGSAITQSQSFFGASLICIVLGLIVGRDSTKAEDT